MHRGVQKTVWRSGIQYSTRQIVEVALKAYGVCRASFDLSTPTKHLWSFFIITVDGLAAIQLESRHSATLMLRVGVLFPEHRAESVLSQLVNLSAKTYSFRTVALVYRLELLGSSVPIGRRWSRPACDSRTAPRPHSTSGANTNTDDFATSTSPQID